MALAQTNNPYLEAMEEDVLYHLGLSTSTHDLAAMFGDIRFVCMGGTPQRMENFAKFIMKEIDHVLQPGTCLQDISRHSHRYAMFKVGPVLCISHGMGVPSMSIVLHEVIKLLSHAKARDPVFFRLGTCGGVDVDPGNVVITEEALDGLLRPVFENIILGKIVQRPTQVDPMVIESLMKLGEKMKFTTVTGRTLCTNDFYEGQGRVDGAFCNYTKEDKMEYMNHLKQVGVKNIEMESTCFTAMTHMAKCRSAVICVVLVNRLCGDQILATKETMIEWQNRPQQLVAAYIKQQLKIETQVPSKSEMFRFGGYEDDQQTERT
ncbi:hypothetical protein TCAL_06054 [Tigriopus californicus]|uniref:Nucleoside phosphorylase domain-containing protein n=1 Tax=Tigriopus californicus TaxID=6832 RepID=A0A553PNP6_TIGCA|nr:uridine phosphorylase 1-like [Tigriopus californicus]TRY79304.1 hypothetical protein TCAL_06054 [Tigriopus californicus]|eukprot:TCALIF_06054-PA protein Name:"Similar to Upp2 Uridine phosphorylase 2 (Mus musculus)" AED:0.09 eAED:0.09 QI:294/1/1/1/0.83/0.85/7/140/319